MIPADDRILEYTQEVADATAPLYEHVKSVIPLIEWPLFAPYIKAINDLKKEKNAVILAHNHPSGISEPSESDISITKRLKKALSLIDVRVLDHLVIGHEISSFAKMGLI